MAFACAQQGTPRRLEQVPLTLPLPLAPFLNTLLSMLEPHTHPMPTVAGVRTNPGGGAAQAHPGTGQAEHASDGGCCGGEAQWALEAGV